MGQEDPEELELLLNTPSSALGSCRYKMEEPETDDSDYQILLRIFKNIMFGTSFTMVATTPWTPVIKSTDLCQI